jgi:hypothetical protein
MFTIELLAGSDSDHSNVIERTPSSRYFLYDVEHRAKTLLADARKRMPENPPSGYRILDKDGVVVARFWRSGVGRPRQGP